MFYLYILLTSLFLYENSYASNSSDGEESLNARSTYKIRHNVSAPSYSGWYLDVKADDELFLQRADFDPGHQYYYNQVWHVVPAQGGGYKIRHHASAPDYPGWLLDVKADDELFLQQSDFKPTHKHYYNQIWNIVPAQGGGYKIRHHASAPDYPGWLLDVKADDELFLQQSDFDPCHQYYRNQVWNFKVQ